MTYIYVMPLHENQNGYGNILQNGGLPPPQSPQEETTTAANEPPKGICGRLFGRCRKQTKEQKWWFSKKEDSEVPANEEKVKWWQKLTCCKRKKVGDVERENGSQRKNSWAERRDSFIAEPPKLSSKDKCKNFLRTICCLNFCSKKRKKEEEDAIKRRESLMSKKKSLTPLATVVEEPQTTKLDAGLVEHTSVMKAAIPVLPVPLAWLCLILNVFIPGFGTILSGFFCLCIGKPRFSQKDGPKPRIGACIIDFFIGCGQLFTVLFCLVGWGWSIWWGIIMLKLARKYRKIRRAERAMEEDAQNAATVNHLDVERGV
ncbi:hypothetical protein RI129_010530 [Pyrocoelia pectoralis]|uniref:Protein SPEC3 n=1 Tax=Pyrocoelia pectoralis TaxID=417401 RepID=A0AAN7V9E6_9COLE